MIHKVVHLSSVHPPFDTRIFRKECKSLAQMGYQVALIAGHDTEKFVEDVLIHGFPKSRNRLGRMFGSTSRVLKTALREGGALYHFHDPELIPVGLLLKLRGKKVIYDVHEDVPRQLLIKPYIPKFLRAIIARTIEHIENFSSRRFDAVVCATPHITQRFQSMGCHAVNINNYPIKNELHSPHLDWLQKERVVCYVGGITQVRGITEMVQAVQAANTKLLLAGNFFHEFERQQVMKLSAWENVEELGQLSRQEVAAVLSKAMIGLVVLHPTVNYLDSLPVKMFEYMSAGLPVIASDFPLWRDIIEGNNCGICVDPLDVSAIRDAIQYLLDHPEEAQRLGENGRRAVEEKYNWESEASKLQSLYKELVP